MSYNLRPLAVQGEVLSGLGQFVQIAVALEVVVAPTGSAGVKYALDEGHRSQSPPQVDVPSPTHDILDTSFLCS
jgi:hypothetical protein